jgi:hypothetical protein
LEFIRNGADTGDRHRLLFGSAANLAEFGCPPALAHALRTTFDTLLSKGGVAPRTAQSAMRHSDIKLTMGVYTDPALLDVRGALDALPALPLADAPGTGRETVRATGTDGGAARTVAPTVAPTADNRGQPPSSSGKVSSEGRADTVAASGSPDKKKGRLSTGDIRPPCRGDSRCTFVGEIIGLPLALSIFPQVHDFAGDAVLSLVEKGLYRKGHRVQRSTDDTP